MRRPLLLPLLLAACGRPSAQAPAAPPEPDPALASAPTSSASAFAPATPSPTPPDTQLDPDGDDDPSDPGAGDPPTHGHFERVGRAPLSLLRICDLTVFHDALYAAHAATPLGSDGATITRYVAPDGGGDAGTGAFTVAFDWNRPGEPTKGEAGGRVFSACMP